MNKLVRAAGQEKSDARYAKDKMFKAGDRGNTDAMRMRADEMMGSKSKYVERERKDMERNNFKEKAEALRERADKKTAASMKDEAKRR